VVSQLTVWKLTSIQILLSKALWYYLNIKTNTEWAKAMNTVITMVMEMVYLMIQDITGDPNSMGNYVRNLPEITRG
jgi:hypothetical protein